MFSYNLDYYIYPTVDDEGENQILAIQLRVETPEMGAQERELEIDLRELKTAMLGINYK